MRTVVLALLLLTLLAFSKTDSPASFYPQDFFRWPVDHPIRLSGTFGELRPNHFHAGVDIKSRAGKVGDPILAAGEGFLSRIVVDASGYGNVLYLEHPNGYTTVYAHLNNFVGRVADYVKEQQYARESFEVELFPEPGQFAFRQGEKIGELGNSGSSGGPHLHFEVRHTETERPVNPLLFGLQMEDHRAPRMHQLKVYQFDEQGHEVDSDLYSLREGSGSYTVSGDTLLVQTGQIGFGLKSYDHHDQVSNWNGIFELNVLVDDTLYFNFEMESFGFDETRYINAHLDYEERLRHKAYFNRCFTLPGNHLTIYNHEIGSGLLHLVPGERRRVDLQTADVYGNMASLTFWVKRDPKPQAVAADQPLYNYYLYQDQENLIETPGCTLYFPHNTFYEDLPLNLRRSDDASNGHYSPVFHVHNYLTPVHSYYDISLTPDREIPADKRSKAFVAYCSGGSAELNCGGQWDEQGRLTAKVRDLGDFCILLDEQAPTIQAVSFRSDMGGRSHMSFRIKDELRTARNVEDLTYRATVDGQWILMEYDKKSNLLRHDFDGRIGPGKHQLRLEVKDAVGNAKVFEKEFSR
ncbi:MAG: M23 family metallopeptidase [Saprospiraceae bacterium]|nr:M23 family metallopeptidase [Saprospiraceae bacterium]MCB0626527.1 M23 family metallopeptidase [Saprospiraceae bacterium]MCB0682224.1 M23 family metallopeptidase [Saprospiraceae bacterium]